MAFFGPLTPVSPAAGFHLGRIVHEKNSLYNSIFVYQDGSVATLRFGKRASLSIQSQVDMDNPHVHMLEYTKLTFCGLLYTPAPKRMLVLGLGGGVIPREMRRYFPALEIDIAEIDPDILPIASQFLGFQTDDKKIGRAHV